MKRIPRRWRGSSRTARLSALLENAPPFLQSLPPDRGDPRGPHSSGSFRRLLVIVSGLIGLPASVVESKDTCPRLRRLDRRRIVHGGCLLVKWIPPKVLRQLRDRRIPKQIDERYLFVDDCVYPEPGDCQKQRISAKIKEVVMDPHALN